MKRSEQNGLVLAKRRMLFLAMVTGTGACFISFTGFRFGRTTVQLIDFIKRTIEVSSVIAAYCITTGYKGSRIQKAETVSSIIVSFIMLVSACLLGIVAFINMRNNRNHGNVVLGLIISCGDILMNLFFLRKYTGLNMKCTSPLVRSQRNFYLMKVLSNCTVLVSLVLLFVIRQHRADKIIDTAASVILILISITVSLRNLLKTKEVQQEYI